MRRMIRIRRLQNWRGENGIKLLVTKELPKGRDNIFHFSCLRNLGVSILGKFL